MEKLLETYNLRRLNQDEIKYLNRPTIKNILRKAKDQSGSFIGELCQTFKELIPIFSNSFKKTWRGGNTSRLMLQDQHYFDTVARKGHYQKTNKQIKSPPPNYRLICLININAKILNKILGNGIQCHIKISFIITKWN